MRRCCRIHNRYRPSWRAALGLLALSVFDGNCPEAKSLRAAELLPIERSDERQDEPSGVEDTEISLDDVFASSPLVDEWVTAASFWQPPPTLRPQPSLVPPVPLPPAASELERLRIAESTAGALRRRATTDVVTNRGTGRPSTDAGNVLRQSPAALGVTTQRRTPIVHDPRIRGSRVGQLAASGSYWVPARIDLETPLSSFDSQVIQEVRMTKGPYDVRQGPGFNFLAVDFGNTPRFNEFEMHGSTRLDYQTNGEQWLGRQAVWGGDNWWGYQIGYSHRTGSDYETADGVGIPSSYKSRAWDFAYGADLTADSRIELHGLRLDQTDVEFPGQAFDIDLLMTDGYEMRYLHSDPTFADRVVLEGWYNRTQFDGSTGRAGKRRIFPLYTEINLNAVTDVESLSTGARAEAVWDIAGDSTLSAGLDLRHVRQELEEFASYRVIGMPAPLMTSAPIPRSSTTNPGLFAEYRSTPDEHWQLTAGTRVDIVAAEVLEDNDHLQDLGVRQQTLQELLGTSELDQTFVPWAAFLEVEYALTEVWSVSAAAGHSERPPSLTELYAAQPFMFLLQNGLNTVRGDPRLEMERLWQLDVGTEWAAHRLRARVRGFHAWIQDAITFENYETVTGPGLRIDQVNLQYVNTDLATLAGFEAAGEFDVTPMLTALATISYVEGRDHTRNGNQATDSDGLRYPGLPRSTFSGAPLTDEEPLPGIVPLESRIGLQLHEAKPEPDWWLELAARLVARQDRVASTLFESQTPGFTVWDLRGAWQVTEHIAALAGVENFTNELYREHLDFRSQSGIAVNQPGVNFYFGSEIRY